MNYYFFSLSLLLTGLKLTGYIDYSWWVVIAPVFAAIFLAFLTALMEWVNER